MQIGPRSWEVSWNIQSWRGHSLWFPRSRTLQQKGNALGQTVLALEFVFFVYASLHMMLLLLSFEISGNLGWRDCVQMLFPLAQWTKLLTRRSDALTCQESVKILKNLSYIFWGAGREYLLASLMHLLDPSWTMCILYGRSARLVNLKISDPVRYIGLQLADSAFLTSPVTRLHAKWVNVPWWTKVLPQFLSLANYYVCSCFYPSL